MFKFWSTLEARVAAILEASRLQATSQLEVVERLGAQEARQRQFEEDAREQAATLLQVKSLVASQIAGQVSVLESLSSESDRQRRIEEAISAQEANQRDLMRALHAQAERHRRLEEASHAQAASQQSVLERLGAQEGRQHQLEEAAREQVATLLQVKELLAAQLAGQVSVLESLSLEARRQQHIEEMLAQRQMTPAAMVALNPHLGRNFLPNDDSALQKALIALWRTRVSEVLGYADLVESGFRVFSQNDEDGVLLRLFAQIGHTNRYVIEIGSNCSGSEIGIPENLSTNLICNHAWHGAIFEEDPLECERMRYYFAREHATRHFHWNHADKGVYYSPLIISGTVTPDNVNQLLIDANSEPEPDLLAIDIDGGDYVVVQALVAVKPRVLVVEFEKRFRDRYSVVQLDRADFSRRWQQSGAASLPAWEKLLGDRGYDLCAIGSCGFNAFFVRSDVASGKLSPVTATEAFDRHAILSTLGEDFWLKPDEAWRAV